MSSQRSQNRAPTAGWRWWVFNHTSQENTTRSPPVAMAGLSLAAVAAAAAVAGAAAAGDSVAVTVQAATVGFKVSSSFASFSYEVPCAPGMFTFNNAPRTSFVNLMNGLRNASSGGAGRGPNIRIGGNSADESAYIPAPAPLPPNITYRITAADFQAYLSAVPLWNGR
jgi:hypothetical protein